MSQPGPRSSLLVGLALWLAGCAGSSAVHGSGAPVALAVEALDGGSIELVRYRGRVVVLHLFTTWSLAAEGDVPQLQAAHERWRDDVVVIGVALDPAGARLVRPWRQGNGVGYLVGLAPAELVERSLGRISQVPATIVLARDGRVVYWLARPLGDGELAKLVSRLLSSR